ncbi:DUF2294 domain-containing protein [bacterium]|nr:DUF2294 domain-containing protein [bacterium]RIK76071.1 MAG: hypothetical protein DCC62_12115 [candidate division KSB1 bacterium]
MLPIKTKGQLEADLSAAITQFEREYLGRGPREARSFIIQDMLLIRLKGVLTPAEERLASERDGAQLIKQVRTRLIESARTLLEQIIFEKTGAQVVTLHTDISSKNGERIFVFCLNKNLEEELRKI